jgi:hypothetical protein
MSDSAAACSSRSDATHTDWSLCAVCQTDTSENIVIPSKVTRPDQRGKGYHTLAKHILTLHAPEHQIVRRLDDGSGIESTLATRNAVWHKSCYRTCVKDADRKTERQLLEESASPVKTRSTKKATEATVHNEQDDETVLCFFCDKVGVGDMHRASTMELNEKVKVCANELQDTRLLAKLVVMGDMHAMDAMYHLPCLVDLYNRTRACETGTDTHEKTLCAKVLVELVAYLEEAREVESMHVFKLSDLGKQYKSRLIQLGATTVPERVNTTRLKERLLQQIPDLKAYTRGKEVMLAFEHDVTAALHFASQSNLDTNSMHLCKAAQIIRNEIFNTEQKFEGSFSPSCQEDSVPTALLTLIKLILEGPTIIDQAENDNQSNSAALTLSQLMIYNSVKQSRVGATRTRHAVDRETPIPLYTALVIHAQTRKRDLVDKFYRLGLCVSYARLMQVSTDMGNKVCALYESTGVVCPPKMKRDLFTTGCADNIDHNPSSRTSKGAFHGTAISLTQHPSEDVPGNSQEPSMLHQTTGLKTLLELPESYTDVIPVNKTTAETCVPGAQHKSHRRTATSCISIGI